MKISYCLMLVFLFGSSFVTAQHHMKRAAPSSQDQSSLVNSINGLYSVVTGFPVIGPLITKLMNEIRNFIIDLEIITNGALGRVLGGALPCTLSISNGLICEGVDSANGGVGKLIMEIINNVPSFLLPSIFKKLIGVLISAVIDPTFDIAFGGIDIA